MRSPGCTRSVVGSSRMRAPARSSRSVAVIMARFHGTRGSRTGRPGRTMRSRDSRRRRRASMDYNDAQLDPSSIEDSRGGGGMFGGGGMLGGGVFGGRGVAFGGGGLGIVGVV